MMRSAKSARMTMLLILVSGFNLNITLHTGTFSHLGQPKRLHLQLFTLHFHPHNRISAHLHIILPLVAVQLREGCGGGGLLSTIVSPLQGLPLQIVYPAFPSAHRHIGISANRIRLSFLPFHRVFISKFNVYAGLPCFTRYNSIL